jgi:hypothetical protein
MMKRLVIVSLSIAAAACGQGNSDNVMSPEANAVSPAQVNAALGPEVTNSTDMNAIGNDMNASGEDTNTAYPPDEPGMSNNTAQ